MQWGSWSKLSAIPQPDFGGTQKMFLVTVAVPAGAKAKIIASTATIRRGARALCPGSQDIPHRPAYGLVIPSSFAKLR